jgi:hypothetical protein
VVAVAGEAGVVAVAGGAGVVAVATSGRPGRADATATRTVAGVGERLAGSTGGRRLWAAMAAVFATAAGAGLVVAGGSGSLSRYVSTNGTAGAPFVTLYRLSVLAAAGAAIALACALRTLAGPAALALGAAAAPVALSAAVTCSAGCPLPPYQQTTPRDLLHAAASAAGVGCCALAMLHLAVRSADAALAIVSRGAVAVVVPALAAIATSMLAGGQGLLSGLLERVVLAACLTWLVAIAVLLTRPRTVRPRLERRTTSTRQPAAGGRMS